MRTLEPAEAVLSFAEIALGYSSAEAIAEARRAEDADFAPSQAVCPFGVDVTALVSHTAAGDFGAALGAVTAAHPWAGVMGRWCHRPCEGVQAWTDREPIGIGALERAAADHGDGERPPFVAGPATGKRVAVLGAGSGGSAVAYRLRQHGHEVAVFDRLPVGGGMKTIGFPEFRLPQRVVQRDNALADWGVQLHLGLAFNPNLVGELLAQYDAVVAATGKFKAIALEIPGEELAGVYDALDFLTRVKLGRPLELGKRVVVLGAGYAAQDASRTVRRLGRVVTIYYRRTEEEMPVRPERRAQYLADQQAEDAPYVFQMAPVRIIGQDGRVVGVELIRTELGAPDASGRPAPVPVAGSQVTIPCDTVVAAIGEECDLSYLPDAVATTEDGHVRIDPATFRTSLPGLYAVGEMTGLKGTTAALRAGLTCGDMLDRALRSGTVRDGP